MRQQFLASRRQATRFVVCTEANTQKRRGSVPGVVADAVKANREGQEAQRTVE